MARHFVPGQRQARGAGFTLLELIIVIVVIGIIGVVASARIQDDTGYTESASCGASIAANAPTFLAARGDEIGAKGVSITFSEGVASPSYIDFDYLGRPITATGSCASDICRVTFAGTATVGVCIEAEGLIYAC